MRYYKFLILFLIMTFSSFSFAKSCEKNGSCRERLKSQKDPIDLERESSRAHTTIFFMSGFAVNRFLESNLFENKFGRKLSKNERILYTAVGLTAAGLVKELVYDADGLSRSDVVSNAIGIGLSMTLEWTLF